MTVNISLFPNEQPTLRYQRYNDGDHPQGWLDIHVSSTEVTIHNMTPTALLDLADALRDVAVKALHAEDKPTPADAMDTAMGRAANDPDNDHMPAPAVTVPSMDLADALNDPAALVAGMTETSATHNQLPEHLRPVCPGCGKKHNNLRIGRVCLECENNIPF